MKIIAVTIVALVIGFLAGVILSDFINPALHPEAPYGAPGTMQKN